MQRNVAGQKIGGQLITAADGTDFTSAVTVYVTGDAGSQAAGSVGSGACTHEGNGYHTYAPAQAETDYDLVAFTFKGTGAITATVQVATKFDANVISSLDVAVTNEDGTAQAGGASTITLAAAASAADNYYNRQTIEILGGSGAGQKRIITTYVGATRVATVHRAWATNPSSDSTYLLGPGEQDAATVAGTAQTAGDLAVLITTVDTVADSILVDTAEIGTAGAGLTNINLPNQTMDIVGNITGNLSGSAGSVTGAVGSVTGLTASDVGAIKAKTDALPTDPADQSLIISATDTIIADTNDIQSRLPAALGANGNMKADLRDLLGVSSGAAAFDRAARGIVLGTVGSASTTTSIVTSSLTPAAVATDQLKGRIVIFDSTTTTVNLRGQASDITGSTSGGVLSVTALTTAPVSGDSFCVQ